MERSRSMVSMFLWILIGWCAPIVGNAGEATKLHYRMELLEGIPDTMYPTPQAVNDKGQVLVSSDSTVPHSYLWKAGNVTEIVCDGFGHWSKQGGVRVTDMNDNGQVVGSAFTAHGAEHAFLWERGRMLDLGTLGGKSSEAEGINNLGQVVGFALNQRGNMVGFLWDRVHGMSEIKLPERESRAERINDAGHVIVYIPSSLNTVLWKRGKVTRFPAHPFPGSHPFEALALNNHNTVVGSVDLKDGGVGHNNSRVVLYSAGKMTVLDALGSKSNNTFGISDSNVVVGNALDTPTGQHVFIWQQGASRNLNDLLPDPKGWNIAFCKAVSRHGRIAANGTLNGKRKMVLLTPTP